MSYPKQPGQDAEAHMHVTQTALAGAKRIATLESDLAKLRSERDEALAQCELRKEHAKTQAAINYKLLKDRSGGTVAVSDATKLEPCPFCGGKGKVFRGGKLADALQFYVQCQGCSASVDCSVEELLAKKWNRRTAAATIARLTAENEELRETHIAFDVVETVRGQLQDAQARLDEALAELTSLRTISEAAKTYMELTSLFDTEAWLSRHNALKDALRNHH